MQILKGKKDRMPDYNQYTSQNPHQTYTHMDKVMAMKDAIKRQVIESPEGKTHTQVYEEDLENRVVSFANSYPPEFAKPDYNDATVLINESWEWNVPWLRERVKGSSWDYFHRYVTTNLLKWYGWDGIEDWIKVEEAALQKINNTKNNP